MNKMIDKIHDYFRKRPVLVLVIELLYIGLMAFALSLPAIKGDAEMLDVTGYIDTKLWYAYFGIFAIFVCCIDGVFMAFDEFRKRKGELTYERESESKE